MLGANRLRVFTRIILPLSAPGVLTAALLVFVLAISSFVTPRLMGGGRVFVLGTEVFNEATVTLNWPLAAALSVMLLILFSSIILLTSALCAHWRREQPCRATHSSAGSPGTR
ncbi:ABC transporter permease subunit (plasmid) [Neorhizobium galegae]|nr:ABC transporter permease subunit [Neorhizobium galegae]